MNYIQKAILIAGAAFCFNLTMSAQDITLKNKNITVKEAMEELKKTSGYSFVFSSKDVNTGKRISISANKASIEEVVNQILKGQTDLTYEIRDKKIIVRKAVSNAAPAQAGKVKGTHYRCDGYAGHWCRCQGKRYQQRSCVGYRW